MFCKEKEIMLIVFSLTLKIWLSGWVYIKPTDFPMPGIASMARTSAVRSNKTKCTTPTSNPHCKPPIQSARSKHTDCQRVTDTTVRSLFEPNNHPAITVPIYSSCSSFPPSQSSVKSQVNYRSRFQEFYNGRNQGCRRKKGRR